MDSWSDCAADNLVAYTDSVDKVVDGALRSRTQVVRTISRIENAVRTFEIRIERWMEICDIVFFGMGSDDWCSVTQISNHTVRRSLR